MYLILLALYFLFIVEFEVLSSITIDRDSMFNLERKSILQFAGLRRHIRASEFFMGVDCLRPRQAISRRGHL